MASKKLNNVGVSTQEAQALQNAGVPVENNAAPEQPQQAAEPEKKSILQRAKESKVVKIVATVLTVATAGFVGYEVGKHSGSGDDDCGGCDGNAFPETYGDDATDDTNE